MDVRQLMMMMMTTSAYNYMMRKFRFYLIPVFVLMMGMPSVRAQQKDFQLWPSANINMNLTKRFRVMVEEEVRLKENCTQMDKQINDLGISYKINKYFRASFYYRVMASWRRPDDYNWKNGLYGDLAFRYNAGRFLLGYRFRYQSARTAFNKGEDVLSGNMVNRHKFTVGYNIKNMPLVPFVEEELFFQSDGHQMGMNDYRTWIGLTYAPGKVHEFSLKYGIDQQRLVADPVTAYIIALNYTLNLKL
jgi:hypothetical protein